MKSLGFGRKIYKQGLTQKNMHKNLKLILINSAIAAGISFFSAWAVIEEITLKMFIISLSAALVVFLTKLRDHFSITNKKGERGLLFDFI